MRQAVPILIATVLLAIAPAAHGKSGGADAKGAIDQARRLIEAKDFAPAANLLEDALPDADGANRPAILDLLRQCYESLARAAKAAGRDREAARYMDDLEIIAKLPGKPLPAKPKAEPKRKEENSKTAKATNPTPLPLAQSPPATVTRGPALGAPGDESPPAVAPAPAVEPAKSAPELARPLGPVLTEPSDSAAEPAPLVRPAMPVRNASDSVSEPKDPPAQVPDGGGEAAAAPREMPPSTAPAEMAPAASPTPGGRSIGQPSPTGPVLEDGDRLFAAAKYLEAGQIYALLARQNRLPARRAQHWAYCRMVDVVRKINLHPQSAREWDEIDAEIVRIQRLSPNIWYAEYLRSKVAEVRRTGRKGSAKSNNLIVRGTAPDDNPSPPAPAPRRLPRLFGNGRNADATNIQPATPPADSSGDVHLNLPGGPSPAPAPTAGEPMGESGGPAAAVDGAVRPAAGPVAAQPAPAGQTDNAAWQIKETANFRIFHRDDKLAEAAAQAAENVRAAQTKRWGTPFAQRPWAPQCEIYLYPSGKVFARETKQQEESPGFSSIECSGSRVVARRVNLRADHPQTVTAVLPHEVTHVVLADLFTAQQIPRWADEGLAVLAEPRVEQETRAAELDEPLQSGRVFELRKLMAMDYPEAKDWSLYYAQSVSLTRFLVELAEPEQFVQFVVKSQREGIENALRSSYRIAGFAELEDRWTEYARRQAKPAAAASRDRGAQPAEAAVR